jgi:hypothetical protein
VRSERMLCVPQILSRFLPKLCRHGVWLRGVFGRGAGVHFQVAGSVRAAPEHVVGTALQEPVEDRLCQVAIMEHLAERRQWLVGGDDDRPAQSARRRCS